MEIPKKEILMDYVSRFSALKTPKNLKKIQKNIKKYRKNQIKLEKAEKNRKKCRKINKIKYFWLMGF
jgi:hypothetical protein